MTFKPYYEHGGIRIFHGDSRVILPTLEGVKVIVSDPPYGISYAHAGTGLGKHSRRNTAKIHDDDKPFDPTWLLGYRDVLLWGANNYARRLPLALK